jgi:hypothetical protein
MQGEDQNEYFHRSNTPLQISTILTGTGLVNNVEPAACLSRRNAVFMTREPRAILDGVQGAYVYRVEPRCRVERRDNAFYGNVQKAYLKRKYRGRAEEHLLAAYPDWNEQTIETNVDAYWSAQSANPNWEYLTSRAVVVELIV